jgi:hypothetical protein
MYLNESRVVGNLIVSEWKCKHCVKSAANGTVKRAKKQLAEAVTCTYKHWLKERFSSVFCWNFRTICGG